MSTTATATTVPTAGTADRAHPLRRATLVSGAVAAVATTAVAVAARAVDVPLAIDGEAIPVLGFAQLTLIGAILGGLLVAACNRFAGRARRAFLTVSIGLTALSCVPSVAWPPDVATKVVLVTTHVLAATIIVPALARQPRS
jgi:hypothetical protein